MFISEGIHVHSVGNSNDESSSVLMVDMKKKEDSDEPISQLQNVVKMNQEPVGKGNTQLDDPFIAEQMKETQEEISFKDSAKVEVCQVHSLTPSMSQYENALVKMMNSETSNKIYKEIKQDEKTQDDFISLIQFLHLEILLS
ncbi:hypothetical protein MKW92_004540 [Papaver armeniacum]|nr:hypothetical protein MKW92_004540 [Papaver armeniacum]